MTEYDPVYPLKHKWQCSCGVINDKTSYVCRGCGTDHDYNGYINPCDSCGLCENNIERVINSDFQVKNNIKY